MFMRRLPMSWHKKGRGRVILERHVMHMLCTKNMKHIHLNMVCLAWLFLIFLYYISGNRGTFLHYVTM